MAPNQRRCLCAEDWTVPVKPRGDTSGRRRSRMAALWPDMSGWVWGMNGLVVRLRDGTEWRSDYGFGREWVCIRGPRHRGKES